MVIEIDMQRQNYIRPDLDLSDRKQFLRRCATCEHRDEPGTSLSSGVYLAMVR